VAVVQAVLSVTSSVMLAMGRSDWLYRWGLAYCLAGAVVMMACARWGLLGVSLGLAGVMVVLAPLEMKMSLSLIDMRLSTYLRSVLPLVLVTVVMAAAARLAAEGAALLEAGVVLQLAAAASTGGVVYAFLIWHSGLPAVDDARRVLGRWAKRR
jgi:hypothetical protein